MAKYMQKARTLIPTAALSLIVFLSIGVSALSVAQETAACGDGDCVCHVSNAGAIAALKTDSGVIVFEGEAEPFGIDSVDARGHKRYDTFDCPTGESPGATCFCYCPSPNQSVPDAFDCTAVVTAPS